MLMILALSRVTFPILSRLQVRPVFYRTKTCHRVGTWFPNVRIPTYVRACGSRVCVCVYLGNEPLTKLYQLVTCGNDHDVKLWEITVVQAKREIQPFTAKIIICRIMEKHSSALTCIRFSANGLYVVSSSLDKTTIIWETVAILPKCRRYKTARDARYISL